MERSRRPRRPPLMMAILAGVVIVMGVALGLFFVATIVAFSVALNTFGSNK